MTTAVLTHRPAVRQPRPPLLPRLADKLTGFAGLVADSVRLANALEAGPTAASRQKLTERFVEANRPA